MKVLQPSSFVRGGDKFRDPVDYTIEDMEAAADETVVRLPNMIVTALTENGFVLTDGNDYAFVKESPNQVSVGDKVSVVGEKFTDGMRMAYIIGGKSRMRVLLLFLRKHPLI